MANDLELTVLSKAQKWLDGDYDAATKEQVKLLMDNDMKELTESFYKDLEFGTGGLRGIMGVGSNRMNIYTVGTATQWADKTTIQIYDDVIKLFGELATNSAGRITIDSDLVLAAPPAVMVMLGKSTDYGKSVIDILKNYFTNISFVTLPELANVSGNSVLLAARTVDGAPVAELGYSEKMRSHQLIPELSSYKQKFSAGTH